MNNVLGQAFFTKKKLNLSKIQSSDYFGKLIRKELSFLLFEIDNQQYLYLKNYGGLVYFNVNNDIINELNALICSLNDTSLSDVTETLNIRISHKETINATFDELVIPHISLDYAHIICLNLSQSVALSEYQSISDVLLDDTKKYTNDLEIKGKVSLKRKQLMQFIGATLNLKNQIAEHLYIFERPDIAWEDQNINKIDRILNEDLEIKYRYNAIKEQLNIVKENLDHFKDLNLHEHSSKLEWIIIILILFEIIHLLIEKLFY